MRVHARRACHRRCRTPRKLDTQRAHDRPGDFVLNREDVVQFTLERVGPEMEAICHVDELRRHPNPVLLLAHAPL